MQNISVIPSETLSSSFDKRYVVVDKETGKVLDDAQGYGFRSVKAAYACYGYKNRSPEKKKKEKEIQNWIREHKKFCDNLSDSLFYEVKDDPDFKLDSKYIEACFKEAGLALDVFTAAEFLRVWKRH